jgi:glycosylphosphatidylinositol transamidase (GPIT) subunit GPI8
MSSMLLLEERMRTLVDEEVKYLNKLEETQKQFGSMTPHGVHDLISLCKIKQAQEELAKEIEKLAQEKILKEIVNELNNLLAQQEIP